MISLAQKKILEAGLPPRLADRLALGNNFRLPRSQRRAGGAP